MSSKDLTQYRSKLIGSNDERAVSPVIGVILMVAITVILAAVIAAFVLDMGQGQSQSAQAGIQFNEESASGGSTDVTVTVNSIERADELRVEPDGTDCTGSGWSSSTTLNSVGQSVTVNCGTSGGTIQVIGTYDGSDNVINTYEYDG